MRHLIDLIQKTPEDDKHVIFVGYTSLLIRVKAALLGHGLHALNLTGSFERFRRCLR